METAGTKDPNQGKKPSKSSKEPMKVKYIADPVRVNAKDATEFKVIVQELTGKDSSPGNRRRGSPGSGSSGTALVAGGHPQLGYRMDQYESFGSVGYHELDKGFFCQVSESLSRFEFP